MMTLFRAAPLALFIWFCMLSPFDGFGQSSPSLPTLNYETVAAANLDTIVLLDVRTPNEFAAGHIPGATLVNIMEVGAMAAFAEKLSKQKTIYVYCHSGVRSRQAASLLTDLGFKNVYDYRGGYADWAAKHRE